jgi:hypothetical protein
MRSVSLQLELAGKQLYRYTELFGLYRAGLQAEEQMLD